MGNNHHLVPFEGEDIQIFERDLPGENTAGLSGQEIGRLPLETCQTMNGMWGYKITDLDYKSSKTLIHYLVRAAGRNGNLLLNIDVYKRQGSHITDARGSQGQDFVP